MILTAKEFNELKKKIKTEMNRRCGYGSLESLGGAAYDFVELPIRGGAVKTEHGQKTVDLLLSIEDRDGLQMTRQGEVIMEKALDSQLVDYVDCLAMEPIEGDSASCRGACTGLCFGSCISGCNGCTSTCGSGCLGCTATCGSGCASSSRIS